MDMGSYRRRLANALLQLLHFTVFIAACIIIPVALMAGTGKFLFFALGVAAHPALSFAVGAGFMLLIAFILGVTDIDVFPTPRENKNNDN